MRSYRLASVLDFEIRVHISWIVIFVMVVHSFATEVLPVDLPDVGTGGRIGVAAVTAVLFFASLLGHELAHSLVARRSGIVVEGITLFIFGGVAQLRNEPRSPGEEFRIAIAGPVASVAIGGAFQLLLGVFDADATTLVPAVVCLYLMYLNWILAVFNLLPAFPMDGGRIVRAGVWRITRDARKATRLAARTGQAFALALFAFGAYRFNAGETIGGIWMALIGLFVFSAASRTRRVALQPEPEPEPTRYRMFVIPAERLPAGFAEHVEEPPTAPSEPRPAATVVLLRDAAAGPELLLLRRHGGAGFVPGAWVFPGGRVDAADADPRALGGATGPAEPPTAFRVAAAREVFEEAGVLLARGGTADATHEPLLAELRAALLDDRATMADVLARTGRMLRLEDLVYFAHWITPVVEPRRYDTRFFLARLPAGSIATPDPREMTDSLWATPRRALERFEAGELPMVFPTVRTIEALAGFASVDAALDAFRGRAVRPILPRLVRTPGGVGIVTD